MFVAPRALGWRDTGTVGSPVPHGASRWTDPRHRSIAGRDSVERRSARSSAGRRSTLTGATIRRAPRRLRQVAAVYSHGMTEEWTPGDIGALIGNPFYAINLDPILAEPHKPLIDEETWIQANVKQIEDLGPEVYLRNLLAILKGNFPRS